MIARRGVTSGVVLGLGLVALALLLATGGSDAAWIIAALLALFVFSAVVPFALGVIAQLVLRDTELPWYAILIGALFLVAVKLLGGPGASTGIDESPLWGAATSGLFAAWFIAAGSAVVSHVRKRRRTATRDDSM